MMQDFDSIIAYNYKASTPPPKFILPEDNEPKPEGPERKSLTKLIVTLAVILTIITGLYLFQSTKSPALATPERPGVTCMDEPEGGVYCWKAK